MSSKNSKYYTIAITGPSGLVGTALQNELSQRTAVNGKPIRIVRLQRASTVDAMPSDDDIDVSVQWNPNAAENEDVIHPTVLQEVDAVVHLAGENVATGLGPLGFLGIRPWTAEKKAKIMDSRVGPTAALAKAISQSGKRVTFLSSSGVGVYGTNIENNSSGGNDAVDESMDTSETKGFLKDVTRAWEAATKVTTPAARVVSMRFGVVMSLKGGALAKLYPIFALGGGGIVGSGRQYFSFISARDVARGIVHVLETPSLSGPVNVCAPEPCTNLEFTKALGSVLNRPTFLPFPSFAVDTLFGEMGNEMLLESVRAVPTKLQQSGFQFLHPNIEQALNNAINEEKDI